MPRSRLMLNSPAASADPVEPPDTSAWASPLATALAARTIEASGVERTACAGSDALAIETGASITVTPGPTSPISAAGPYSSTSIAPAAAAVVAPAAPSAGPRSAPPASTATVTIGPGGSVRLLLGPGDDLTAPVAAADRADPVRTARAMAVRALVVDRRG